MKDAPPKVDGVKLSLATLQAVPDGILRPVYDRSKLTAGIVHIGLGNFHRAHQAWYLHRLMQQGHAYDWAIIGAGVRPYDADMREKLLAQDCLTTLIELAPTSSAAEITGPMIDYLPIEADNGALIAQMADPSIRIVSLTVTESGYFVDPATKGFDAAHPDIVHDAANPATPKTAFGAMIAALAQRRAAGVGPFTCQSCDNLLGNGAVLRQTIVSLARLSDPDLADWIDRSCSFPNSMVDSIVPATGPDEIARVEALGIHDAAPVTHENFRQWVIEDDFCAGRPDWDLVGATFSDDVHGYEAMKIQLLNGGHQIIACAGEILGLETIADCMAHDGIAGLFAKVAETEIAPLVKPVSDTTAQDYTALIQRRFSNPSIVDTTRRVAYDGSARHPGFIIPSIRDRLAQGLSANGLALVEAIWARMCAGVREDGSTIEPNDPQWEVLTRTAQEARTAPGRWLEMAQIYGDLATDAGFVQSFETWLSAIWADGLAPTLQRYIADPELG